jgi:hypothetical protein
MIERDADGLPGRGGMEGKRRDSEHTHLCCAKAHGRRAGEGGNAKIAGSSVPRPTLTDPALIPPLVSRYRLRSALLAAVLALLAWGAFAPLGYASRRQLLEIPPGTRQHHLRGEPVPGLPAAVTLTLGVQDVLLLRNADSVAHVFGPVQLRPGEEFSLPFEQAGAFRFDSSVEPGGQMEVRVVEAPDPGWGRLRWRARNLVHELRYLPLVAPG